MKITHKKIMVGWYEILADGLLMGRTHNFQGFWKVEIIINGKSENAYIGSNTRKTATERLIKLAQEKGIL